MNREGTEKGKGRKKYSTPFRNKFLVTTLAACMMMRRQEQQRQQLDEERKSIVTQLNAEKEDVVAKLTAEINQLRTEVAAVQRDRDDQLIAAENDHQQVCLVLVRFASFPLRLAKHNFSLLSVGFDMILSMVSSSPNNAKRSPRR